MDLQLKGKSVLVTGAWKGSATRLRRRSQPRVHAAPRRTLGGRAGSAARGTGRSVSHAGDIARDGPVAVFQHAASRAPAGDVDILVNNAGEIPSGPIESLDRGRLAAWIRPEAVRLHHADARDLRADEGARTGVIINDIGNSGENWDANYIAGSTGNAALMAFTKALGGQSLDFGVRVVGVNPGPVETERMVKINKRRALDMVRRRKPLEGAARKISGRAAGDAEEVADLMVFLASPRAGYITGTIVTIDGGISARGSIIKERSVRS